MYSATNNFSPIILSKYPMVKDQDTRCSRNCRQNWTKFGQKVPIWHMCYCTMPKKQKTMIYNSTPILYDPLLFGPPTVKERDTRCSRDCIKNWTDHKQKIPIGHYCECSMVKRIVFMNLS